MEAHGEARRPWEPLLRWAPVAVVCSLVGIFATGSAGPIGDPDLWWHLRLGNELIHQHSLSAPAHWSTFATRSWVPTEPLPEIVAAGFERWFGLAGVAWLYAWGLITVIVTVYLTNRLRGGRVAAATATLLASVGLGLSLTERPQLLSFCLLPIVLAAWRGSSEDLRPRWWLVPITWLWSLMHGFWVMGVAYGVLVVIGVALGRRTSPRALARLASVPLLCAASVLLNPVGLGVFEAPLAVSGAAKWVGEWQRTDLAMVYPLAVELMIVLTVVAWVIRRSPVSWTQILLVLSAVFWVWYAYRLVAVAALVIAPLFTEAWSGGLRRERETPESVRARSWEVGVVAGWSALCLLALALAAPSATITPQGVPLGLDARLDRLAPGTTVFNTYGIGGWLTWRHPDLNQGIDGLVTPYPQSYVDGYHHALLADPGWKAFVDGTGSRVALLQVGTLLIPKLESDGWTRTGAADGYVLLQR